MDKRFIIVGCGPGSPDLLTLRARDAIERADVVVGSRRLLDTLAAKRGVRHLVLEGDYREILEEVARLEDGSLVAFLVSGDPLLYSLGELIVKKFGRENCEVIPGVSSFQYAFCMLGESWRGYRVLSLHGSGEVDLRRIFEENARLIIFLDPEHNPGYIKRSMGSLPEGEYTFHVASNLSMPGERIIRISFDDLDSIPTESLSILIVRKGGA